MATSIAQKLIMATRGYITAMDAAKATGQHVSTIYRWKDHEVEEKLVGNRWYVNVESAVSYCRQQDPDSPYIGILRHKLQEYLALAQEPKWQSVLGDTDDLANSA